MKNTRVRRWFAAGMAGALFALMTVVAAGSVAAATVNNTGLVQPYPGQDPQSPIQVVNGTGYVQNGTQANPITSRVNVGNGNEVQYVPVNNGGYVGPGNPYYPQGYGYQPGYGYPPGYGYAGYGGVYPPGACGVGSCGYTAAGPIVGYDANGNPLVYDVRGGTVDPYTTDKNGNVCEADSTGACQRTK